MSPRPKRIPFAGEPQRGWLRAPPGTRSEALAAALEVNVATVSRYINGRRMPGPEVMARIFKLTDGEIQPNDFYRLGEGAGKGGGQPSEASAEEGT